MKRKHYKTLLSLMLAVCLLVTSAVAAAPEDSYTVQPRYTGIAVFDVSFDINNGVAECQSSIDLSSVTYTGKLYMTLLRSSDGVTWSSYKKWNASGSVYIELDETYAVAHGYYYKLHCSANVYDADGNLLGINTATHDTIIYY